MGLCDETPSSVNNGGSETGTTGGTGGGGSNILDGNGSGSGASDGKYNISTAYVGDSFKFDTGVLELDGEPINYGEHTISFGFSDQRFCEPLIELLYEPDPDDYEYDEEGWLETDSIRIKVENGNITFLLLDTFTATLRRGSYMFSVRAKNTEGVSATVYVGYVLMEYSPTSPHRNIPYKTLSAELPEEYDETT